MLIFYLPHTLTTHSISVSISSRIQRQFVQAHHLLYACVWFHFKFSVSDPIFSIVSILYVGSAGSERNDQTIERSRREDTSNLYCHHRKNSSVFTEPATQVLPPNKYSFHSLTRGNGCVCVCFCVENTKQTWRSSSIVVVAIVIVVVVGFYSFASHSPSATSLSSKLSLSLSLSHSSIVFGFMSYVLHCQAHMSARMQIYTLNVFSFYTKNKISISICNFLVRCYLNVCGCAKCVQMRCIITEMLEAKKAIWAENKNIKWWEGGGWGL